MVSGRVMFLDHDENIISVDDDNQGILRFLGTFAEADTPGATLT
jgi:hypothetical protein